MAKITPRLCIFNGTTEINTENIEYTAELGIEGITGNFEILETTNSLNIGDIYDLKADDSTYIAEIIITELEAIRNDKDKAAFKYSFVDTLRYTLDDTVNVGYFSLTGGFTTSEVLTSILNGTGYSGDTAEITSEDTVFREFQCKRSRREALQKFERTFGCILEVDYSTKTVYAKTARSTGTKLTFFERTEKQLKTITGVQLSGGLNQPPASTLSSKDYTWNLIENKWATHVSIPEGTTTLEGYCRAEVKHYGISTTNPSDISNATLKGSSITNIMTIDSFKALASMPTEDFIVLSDSETLTVYKYINIDISSVTNQDSSALALLAKQEATGVFSCTITGTETYMPGYVVQVGSSPYTAFTSNDPSSENAATRVANFLLDRLSRSNEYSGEIIDQDVFHTGAATQYLPASEVPSGAIDGVNKDFSLSHTNVRPNYVEIISDGVLITDDGAGNLSDGGTINYSAGTFTLNSAPTKSLFATYHYEEGSVVIIELKAKSPPTEISATTQG